MEPWSRPVPSTISPTDNSNRPVPPRNLSRCTLPSRPVEEISPYHPVPSTKPAPTVLSRLQNLPLPSRLVGKTCPYRPVPPSKPVPTIKSRGHNLSLPSRPAIHCHQSFPSRCRDRQDAVNTMNSYLKSTVYLCIFL